MDKWFKDILPDKDPYHNRGRDQMRKKGVRNSSACVENNTFWKVEYQIEIKHYSSNVWKTYTKI